MELTVGGDGVFQINVKMDLLRFIDLMTEFYDPSTMSSRLSHGWRIILSLKRNGK